MAAISAGGATGKTLLLLSPSSSSSLFSLSLLRRSRPTTRHRALHPRVFLGFTPILCYSSVSVAPETGESLHPLRHSLLLERLRTRHLKETVRGSPQSQVKPEAPRSATTDAERRKKNSEKTSLVASSFEELGLSEEVLGAVRELGISVPTEIQSVGVPAVLRGESLVLGSHTGSGKTLAYMLPLVQLLRHDEELSGMRTKPRRPRAVVLCPTRELTEQVFRVAKSISHHAKFRSIMISGGVRSKPQEDSLNVPVDLVVGTPGRILQHIEEGNLVYGDIKYFVMDEADTMFDKGFGPDIRKFLDPLKKRSDKPGDQGFQTVMVLATMTKAVQSLIDEEFQGIIHLRTSTLHKKVASARHDFIKLSGSENKLESLLQVLEPSLAKGNRVMVFCNTLNSSRAVDHFLTENHIYTVNYHGEVPAEERVENLKKFKSDEGDCPTLVCTDLAARGLDLDVDHVVMFDFPKNSIDYLHRTGRTARMGAKGKVTSLVTKKDLLLADHIDEAMRKNESLESLNEGSVRRDAVKSKQFDRQDKTRSPSLRSKTTDRSPRNRTTPSRFTAIGRKAALSSPQKSTTSKYGGKTASIIDRRSALSVSKPGGKSASVIARTASSSKPVSVKARRTASSSKPVSVKARGTTSSSKPVSVKARGTSSSSKPVSVKARRTSSSSKPFSVKAERTASPSKPASSSRGSQGPRKNRVGAARTAGSKLSVVGFRGRSSMAKKEAVVSGSL